MGDFMGALVVGGALAGGAYLIEQRKRQTQEVYEVIPASTKTDTGSSTKDAIVNWGISTLFGALTGSNTSGAGTTAGASSGSTSSGGVSDWLSSLLGGGSSSGGSGSVSVSDRAILDLIGRAEAPGGYDTVYYGSKLQPPRPITTMTVAEVQDWQARSVAAGSASSAAGRYQIIKDTLRRLVSRGVVSSGELFNANAQDRCGLALMNDAGYARYKSGAITAGAFAQELSRIWAGLPAFTYDRKGRKATGQSYYAGDGLNAATVSQSQVLAALGASGAGVYA
jgi:muramidase (phage lysozyme)